MAKTAFTTSKILTLQQRIHLWETCVVPVLVHGVFCMDLLDKNFHSCQTILFKQMRQVIGDFAYKTHRTHQEVLTKYHCRSPIAILQAVANSLVTTLEHRSWHLRDDDCTHQITWTHLPHILQFLQHELMTGPVIAIEDDLEKISTRRQHRCPHCHFQSDSLANLRRHKTNIDNELNLSQHDFHPNQHLFSDIPQCNRCHRTFPTWHSLHTRINLNACQEPLLFDLCLKRPWQRTMA